MSKPLNINADAFEQEVLKSAVPTLVDFWAPWCMPCRMMGPILEEVADRMGDKAKIVKIDIENAANRALAQEQMIMSIPNMKIFKNGAIVGEFVGMRTKEDLLKGLEKA